MIPKNVWRIKFYDYAQYMTMMDVSFGYKRFTYVCTYVCVPELRVKSRALGISEKLYPIELCVIMLSCYKLFKISLFVVSYIL